MPLRIPDIIAVYLAAERQHDAQKLASCFSSSGVIYDEGRQHRGQAAIQRWREGADTKYSYTSEALTASINGTTVTIRSRVTGSFPGSPVEITQVFQFANDEIVSLEID